MKEKKKLPISGNQLVLIIAIAVITLVFSLINSNFFSYTNLINILVSSTLIGLTAIGITFLIMTGGNDLSYYTYLKQCRYQVQAHFEWNMNRPELAGDRNENKHHEMAKRMIRRGGRRDIFLGTRECQGYVEPCTFGEGAGAFDDLPELALGLMYHGITYADESYDDATRGYLTVNFWRPVMRYGVIEFPRPEDCPLHKRVRPMGMRSFSREQNNFSGLEECSPQGGQAEWD